MARMKTTCATMNSHRPPNGGFQDPAFSEISSYMPMYLIKFRQPHLHHGCHGHENHEILWAQDAQQTAAIGQLVPLQGLPLGLTTQLLQPQRDEGWTHPRSIYIYPHDMSISSIILILQLSLSVDLSYKYKCRYSYREREMGWVTIFIG